MTNGSRYTIAIVTALTLANVTNLIFLYKRDEWVREDVELLQRQQINLWANHDDAFRGLSELRSTQWKNEDQRKTHDLWLQTYTRQVNQLENRFARLRWWLRYLGVPELVIELVFDRP